MDIVENTTFTDPGATASDNHDVSVNVTVSGSVDATTVGSYTLTYSATDSSNNTATIQRTVNVVMAGYWGDIYSDVDTSSTLTYRMYSGILPTDGSSFTIYWDQKMPNSTHPNYTFCAVGVTGARDYFNGAIHAMVYGLHKHAHTFCFGKWRGPAG